MRRFGNSNSQRYSKSLIILQTRELALQCFEMFQQLNQFSFCSAILVFSQQEAELRQRFQYHISTPRRIIDQLKFLQY
ncbi:unnamed protein product [Paramecium sonneborni]|uniref:Uncharacterized protein n=1 Tax=Paramecium sonneborni TaxID=65129 RepID=A0A8S1RQS1_9CILI|nr:unnamed protein product [Paramecium sonneborni]